MHPDCALLHCAPRQGAAMNTDDTPIQILVRYLPGVVGESRRVIHVVRITNVAEIPDVLVALCGERIRPGVAEQLYAPIGAPCNVCLFAASTPTGAELPANPTPVEVTAMSDSSATAPPLTPEAQALLDKVRDLVDDIITEHVSRNGRCRSRGKPPPCESARLADHNLELLS